MGGLAIDPSTQSKTKLKAFQFIDGRPSAPPAEAEMDKENRADDAHENVAPAQAHEKISKASQRLADLAIAKQLLPSTPATRLPLADLIGGSAEAKTSKVATVVPSEEHITWMAGVANVTPNNDPTRKRKRARSSSPAAASSQNEAPAFASANKDNFDGQNLQQSLKTPRADPAADLWNRYAADAGSKKTPSAQKAAAFAHLIDRSSPHSSATVGSVSGLRRWSSCGVEFPSAKKPKRRRTTKFLLTTAEESVHEGDCDRRESKVGRLVERIQETLAKPAEIPTREPSSSSPFPETGKFEVAEAESPTRIPVAISSQRSQRSQRQLQVIPDGALITVAEPAVEPQQSPQLSQSDFGDGDIDMDILEAIEKQTSNATRVVSHPTAQQDVQHRQDQVSQTVHDESVFQAEIAPLPPTRDETVVEADDFEDDEDFFGDDLEFVASMYDARPDVKAALGRQGLAKTPVVAQLTPTSLPIQNSPLAAAKNVVISIDSDDDFGDDDIGDDQFVAAEAAATQRFETSGTSKPHSERNARSLQRFLITRVVDGTYKDERGLDQAEKVLILQDDKSQIPKSATLRQHWVETQCTAGAYVSVVGEFSTHGVCVIDNAENLIILHPDHLISATVVGDAFQCIRKSVLQDRIKATSQSAPPLFYGTLLHEIFQQAMQANAWGEQDLENIVETILPRHYNNMVEIQLSRKQVMEFCRSKFPLMSSWASKFVRNRPTTQSLVHGRNSAKVPMSITKLLEVEEHVWAPTFGLKGNVDATVQVRVINDGQERKLTLPLELKTGKRVSEAHSAQTMLYTLLLGDRYDLDIAYGLLYYLETGEIRTIPAVRAELVHIIMKRNELACYVRDLSALPPILKQSHMCKPCYAQTSCFLYHKLAEDGTGDDFAPKHKFDELVKYLKPGHRDFFVSWNNLLNKEEKENMKFRHELWTMLSSEREKHGRCFARVIVEPGTAVSQEKSGKINRFEYTLVHQRQRSGVSFADSQINVGDPIVISDEEGHYNLASGFITNVRRKRITVAVDRRLHNARRRRPGFDAQVNQDFAGLMEVPSTHANTTPPQSDDESEPTVYRLDKDEYMNGMATLRNNLLSIMDDMTFKASSLRSLIVDNCAPTFKATPSTITLPTSSTLSMNADQEAAVAKVMAAQDYALVLGMPGTGKTTTIAYIIKALVTQGKSVLLASYTHSAVDNILLKLRDGKFSILRLGAVAKVHPEVQDFAILADIPKDSVEAVYASWHNPLVVATTCLGINHALFTQRTFDYCIVDEASQITLPVCLGPMRMAKTTILVGDHFQLPPLVQNKEAREGGYDVSLFRLLTERQPAAVTNLEHQYRMAADIMQIANRLIYGGRLKCGNEAVAQRELRPLHPGGVDVLHFDTNAHGSPSKSHPFCRNQSPTLCHLKRMLQPAQRVVFFNTDDISGANETSFGGTKTINSVEVRLVAQSVYLFLACGVSASDIGVTSFYNSQLVELRQALRNLSPSSSLSQTRHGPASEASSVEMLTVDKYQGRDKECIIVSFVRSNEAGNVGDLLKDWRRVNVAVTRARSKLILIGSKRTLRVGGNDVLKGLVQLCEEQGWMVNLTADALDGHVSVDGLQSQTQPASGLGGSSALPLARAVVRAGECTSPPDGRTRQKRKILGEIGGANVSPTKKRAGAGLKVPDKVGRIGQRGMLNRRPVLRDIANDAM